MKDRAAMKKRRGNDATVMSEDARAPPTMRWGTRSRLTHRALGYPGHLQKHGSVVPRSSKAREAAIRTRRSTALDGLRRVHNRPY